ncbi:hypothetical protein BDN72DRAFT_876304 [Pluteus cervinus]|uniref:Uncharacterized protein n=1 Tax=Pluteus cervinus TaxID=181527 RepID=A0ACD3B527_9AGAR|nr:hypothetical protein BDN72DRAFT_876304 [Pluteus cervinus]
MNKPTPIVSTHGILHRHFPDSLPLGQRSHYTLVPLSITNTFSGAWVTQLSLCGMQMQQDTQEKKRDMVADVGQRFKTLGDWKCTSAPRVDLSALGDMPSQCSLSLILTRMPLHRYFELECGYRIDPEKTFNSLGWAAILPDFPAKLIEGLKYPDDTASCPKILQVSRYADWPP